MKKYLIIFLILIFLFLGWRLYKYNIIIKIYNEVKSNFDSDEEMLLNFGKAINISIKDNDITNNYKEFNNDSVFNFKLPYDSQNKQKMGLNYYKLDNDTVVWIEQDLLVHQQGITPTIKYYDRLYSMNITEMTFFKWIFKFNRDNDILNRLNLMLIKYKVYRYSHSNTNGYIFEQYINKDKASFIIRIFDKNGDYKAQMAISKPNSNDEPLTIETIKNIVSTIRLN